MDVKLSSKKSSQQVRRGHFIFFFGGTAAALWERAIGQATVQAESHGAKARPSSSCHKKRESLRAGTDGSRGRLAPGSHSGKKALTVQAFLQTWMAESTDLIATASSCVSTHTHDRKGAPKQSQLGKEALIISTMFARHMGVTDHVSRMNE